MRFSPFRRNRNFLKNYMRIGERKLLRTGLVPARAWRGQAGGVAPTGRFKLRRQMAAAAAAGKKESVSLSLFVEVNDLEVEEELSTMATPAWAEGTWIVKCPGEHKKAWRKQIFEVQRWKQVRGPAGAVMCETGDLGIKWPQWHALIFEGQGKVDVKLVCPKKT